VSTPLQLKRKAKNVLLLIEGILLSITLVAVGFWADTNTIGKELIEEQKEEIEIEEKEMIEYKYPEQLKAELAYVWERKIETPEEIIIRLTTEAGTNTKIALAIAKCESGLNPEAKHKNRDGSIDRGLWQWNSLAHPEVYDDCAYDAECSTKEFIKYQQANHLSPWVCYSTGRYKRYMK